MGYFVIIFLLFLLGIIWLRVQNAYWAANFIQMIQGAIVVRVLISEQDRAQQPHDTYFDETAYPGDRTTRFTVTDRYASDSRFAGAHGTASSAGFDESRIGQGDEETIGMDKVSGDAYGMRPRAARKYESEYGGSMPSDAGQSEMRASSKTAHSDRSGATDDKIEPVVTVQQLQR